MRLTSSAVVLVLLLGAGCGGDEASFTEDYNRAVGPVSDLGRRVSGKPAGLERLARRAQRARANLRTLEAPDGAADELARVRGELGRVTRALRAVARAARERDPVAHRRALQRLDASTGRVARAEGTLQRAVAD